MKRIVTILSVAALLASLTSCERENLAPDGGLNPDFKVTATIEPVDNTTRVGYTVNNTENTVTPVWQENDQIFGFDDQGNTFTYRVSAVDDGTKEATLALVGEYTPGAASKAYAIYYPDKTVSNFEGSGAARTLAVDLSAQSGALNTSSPVLMCATADITPGGINFSFQNQTAIIGVKAFQLPEAATITSMDLNGVITTGTFSVDGGILKLTPGSTPTKVSITGGSWETTLDGGYNKVKTGVYFASLPTASANLVLDASSSTKTYANVTAIPSTSLSAGNYYYMSKELNERVAAIGTTTYATIDEAWAAANATTSPVTVTLLANCTSSGALNLDNTTSGTGAVTLDLNGKTLSTASQMKVKDARSLTVTDNSSAVLASQGAITSSCSGGAALYVDASTLNFSGGTLSNPGLAKYPLYINGASTATISGGKIYASNYSAMFVGDDATVTISGGELLSENRYGIYTSGTLTVSGGSVTTNASNSDYRTFYNTGGGQLKITGGTFASNAAPVITSNNSSSKALVTGGYFSKQVATGELFTISNSGKCYISAAYTDRPVNSDRSLSDNGSYVRCNRPNPTAATKAAYPFQVGNYDRYWNTKLTYGTTNYTYWFSTLVGAALHASKVLVDITIEPRSNQASVGAVTMENTAGQTITIDVKGKTVGSKDASLLSLGGKVTITDTGSPKGKITSSSPRIINITSSSATVTLDKCVIECTASDQDAVNANASIWQDNSSSSIVLNNAVVYTTNKLSVIMCKNGHLTINGDSEVACTKASAGYPAVCSYGGQTGSEIIINGGRFYSSIDVQYYSTITHGAGGSDSETGTLVIHGGYFYYDGSKSDRYPVRARFLSQNPKITVDGGYFSEELYTNATPSKSITIPNGYSRQTVSPADTCQFSSIPALTGNKYTFGYTVAAD